MQNVIEDIYDLTPMQKGMLFHSLYSPGKGVYVTQLHCTLAGFMDLEAFGKAWQQVVDRHPILRTSFSWEDVERPVQVVERGVALPFRTDDWTGLSRAKQASQLEEFLKADRGRGFELSEAPLMRIAVFQTAADQYEFVWTHHHLLLDGWSVPHILKEAFGLYDAFVAGRTLALERRRPYRDFVAWLRRQNMVHAEQYWRTTLAGFTAPTPLVATNAAGGGAGRTGGPGQCSVWLKSEQTATLQGWARQQRLTLNTLLQGAWALLLSRYSGEDDVVFGATVSGRPPELAGVESMVGLFINTLPVRVQVTADTPVVDWLRELQVRQIEQRQFEYSPLVEVQKWSDVRPGEPLFESLLVFESYPTDDAMWKWSSNLTIREIHPAEQPNYPLTLLVIQGPELGVKVIYDTERFREETIDRLLEHLRNLLVSISSDPTCPVSRVPMLSPSEQQHILLGWNQTARPYPTDRCIHEMVEAQAAHTPDATALVTEDERLTYRQLNGRANQLARFLRARGAGPHTLVAVCMERSAKMIIALLGILKTGAAYVPLDPAYPHDRLMFTLEDSQVQLLITQGSLLDVLPWQGVAAIRMDDDWAVISQENEENLSRAAAPDDLAYVIYTSGSTGRPKGVAIEHRNAVNLIHWGMETFDANELAGVLAATSICFDLSVFEIFVTLSAGGKVILAENALQLPSLSARTEVTLVNTVPSAMAELVRQNALPESVYTVNLAGEPLQRSLVDKIYRRRTVRRVYNLYGPSETTTYSTFTYIPPDERNPPSIGRPVANTQVYLLDRHLQPVPVGAAGEVYIGGRGMARGYLNRPELNNERFVQNPFSTRSGERLYRTGDLARCQPDGTIEFLGRIDNQVKLRGFRIELGEIETVLGSHPAIQDLVLVAREDAQGEKRLVAYLVCRQAAKPGPVELRAFLKEKLPEYMIPSAFVYLEALPLTPNGKVDRKALPAPDTALSGTKSAYAAPRSETEQLLAGIWSQVLGREQVGIHDNFFELGGDSILSIQIISRVNQAGLHLKPRQLFEHPTVAELAAVAGDGENAAIADQGAVTGEAPLTPIQHWFFEQNMEAEHHWNHALLFEVLKPVERRTVEQVADALMTHHDALRLRFRRRAGGLEQYHAATNQPCPFCWVDLSNLSPAEQRTALEARAEELQTTLDLSEGPLVRMAYFDMGPGSAGRLLLILHHLVVDGVSWRILMEDVETLLERLTAGGAQLPPKSTSYQQWAQRLAEWAESDALRSELPHWLDNTNWQESHIPVDKPDGANRWESARTVSMDLTEEETRSLLQAVPAVYGTQVNDVLLAALLRVFSRWTGSDSLLFDLEGHGREPLWDDVDLGRTVGWFTSIHPVLLHAGKSVTSGELLKTVKEQVRRIPNRGVGYGLLRYLSADSGVRQLLSDRPQPELCFNYLGKFDLNPDVSTWLRPAEESVGTACSPVNSRRYLLDINGMVQNGALRMVWTYSEEIHTPETVSRLAEDYMNVLREIISTCAKAHKDRGRSPSSQAGLTLAECETVRNTIDRVCGQSVTIEDMYPCAPLQQEIIAHTRTHADPGVWLCQLAWAFEGDLDVASFERAWRLVIDQHPVLRTAFVWESLTQPVQVVLKSADLPIIGEDWSGLTGEQQEARLARYLQEDRLRGFDLSAAPLLRLALMRLGAGSHQFVWTYHHLVLDGWSLAMVVNQVFTCYEALRRGETPRCVQSDRSYRELITWQSGRSLAGAERYWRGVLQAIPAVESPAGPNPTGEDGLGEAEIVLSETGTTALQGFGRQHGLTLNTLVQGAWALTMSRPDTTVPVVFGTTVSGRPVEFADAESVVGLLTNTLPAVVSLPAGKGLIPWLRELQGQQADMRQYEYASLAQLREWGGLPADSPVFDSVVVFENYPRDASLRTTGKLPVDAGRLVINRVRATEHTHYPLRLIVLPTPGLTVRLVYDRNRFDAETSGQILNAFVALLQDLVHAPD